MGDRLLAKLLTPVLEAISDRIIHSDGTERLEYWLAFEKIYTLYPYKDANYGRICNRYMIGNVLAALTVASELEMEEPVPEVFKSHLPYRPLSSWTLRDWASLEESFQELVEQLKRKDANVLFRGAEERMENGQVDPERAQSVLFTTKAQKIVRYIQVHKILAPIRQMLKLELNDATMKDNEYSAIHKRLVKETWDMVCAQEDENVRRVLLQNIFEKQEEIGVKLDVPRLCKIGVLRQTFRNKPFGFDSLEQRVNLLIDQLSDAVFEQPDLVNYYFQVDEVAEDEDAEDEISAPPKGQEVEHLHEVRNALRNHVGEDPLQEAIRHAEGLGAKVRASSQAAPRRNSPSLAKRGQEVEHMPINRRGSGLYKKSRTATRLAFDDIDDDESDFEFEEKEEDEENDKGNEDLADRRRSSKRELTHLPERSIHIDQRSNTSGSPSKKRRISQKKKYAGRRAWTEGDKTAIIEGVREFGIGKWAAIKDKYVRFEMRTSTQIKDCFRLMLKQNQIPQDILDENGNVEDQIQVAHDALEAPVEAE